MTKPFSELGPAEADEIVERFIRGRSQALRRGACRSDGVRRCTSSVREPGAVGDDKLLRFVERWFDDLGRSRAAEGDVDTDRPLDVVLDEEVVVEHGVEADEWVVELDDDVRELVGDLALDRLAEVLPGNAGVIAAEFEDREILVVSGRIDPLELKRIVVTELTRTASAGS
jgi:hypothetical protein